MLTVKQVEALKPQEKSYRVSDGSGLSLFIEVAPSGSKLWRLRYRWQAKQRVLALGHFPDVSIAEARRRASDARDLLAEGKDPNSERRLEKYRQQLGAANTFRVVVENWRKHVTSSKADATMMKVNAFLDQHILPLIGDKPIGDIKTGDVLAVVKRLTGRGALDVAKRSKSIIGQVFSYAIAHGMAESNPARQFSSSDVIPHRATKHHNAITDPAQLGELLRAADAYKGGVVAKAALQLSVLLYQRPGEIRTMEWQELDLDNALWNLPASKMKMRMPHTVPLPRQALTILRELQPLTGEGKYVLPSLRGAGRPLSENTVGATLDSIGYGKLQSAHGFRATARTLIAEKLNWQPEVIEAALAHLPAGALGATYARVKYLDQRKQMGQDWADYLDKLRAGQQPLRLAA